VINQNNTTDNLLTRKKIVVDFIVYFLIYQQEGNMSALLVGRIDRY